MDKICKVYVSQVKAILPVWGKKEKALVKKLHNDLYDYCEDKKITAIDELYKDFGTPQEFVFNYISLIKPDEISKQINTAKYIKILVASLIAFVFLATTFFGFHTYSKYRIAEELENSTTEHVIREYN